MFIRIVTGVSDYLIRLIGVIVSQAKIRFTESDSGEEEPAKLSFKIF